MAEDEFIVCLRVASLGEAHALTHVLDEEQIPYRERPYHDTAFDGLGLMMHQQVGWGELWVRAEDEPRARAALEAVRAAPLASAPEATPEEPSAADERGAARAKPRKSMRGLWLLILVVAAVVAMVIVSALLGDPNPCDDVRDPHRRAQCIEEHSRPAPPPPRDWR